MAIEHNRQDDSINKVLTAMHDAAPPEDMDTRILHRLKVAAPASSLRPETATHSLTAAWWRGAISGATAATLGASLFFFASHLRPIRAPESNQNAAVANNVAQPDIAAISPVNLRDHSATRNPCRKSAILQTHLTPSNSTRVFVADTHFESTTPSHPAPALPLTAQERGLVQFVRTADPAQLQSLNPETQAHLNAQESESFHRFFEGPAPSENKQNNE